MKSNQISSSTLSWQAALALSRVDFFGAADDDLALIAALEASQADLRQDGFCFVFLFSKESEIYLGS